MRFTKRIGAGLSLAIVGLLILAGVAFADGLPIPGVVVKPGGVAAPGSTLHYEASSKRGITTVSRTDSTSRRPPVHLRFPGNYTTPAVAIDGTPAGISADGSTLAVIKPRVRFPQTRTHLALLRTEPLTVTDRLDLKGDFSFDAISPDGSRLFLIQYLSKANPEDYAVRELDTRTGKLEPKPIVDPTEADPDEMRGLPLTRVSSRDGRWQYTLYTGKGKPFVHALDTQRGRAHCIDLPAAAGVPSPYNERLTRPDAGGDFAVTDHGSVVLATINAQTLEASAPSPKPVHGAPSTGSRAGTDWLLIAGLATVAVGALALTLGWRRRRGGAATVAG
jgi:LPXTG-motif cell wall-anchored protein